MLGLRREDEEGSGEDWSLAEQLGMLRPGDVVTYCFAPRTQPTGIVCADGAVEPAALEARERVVIFDTAHGGALDLSIAQAAIAAGFPPDTISSDYHSHELAHRIDGETVRRSILRNPRRV